MINKKKILAVTLGGNEYPSSNFRLRQYYPYLKEQNYSLTEFNSKMISHPPLPNILGVRGILRKLGYQKFLRKYYFHQFRKILAQSDIIWINKLLRDEQVTALVRKSGKKIVVDFDDAEWLSGKGEFDATMSMAHAAIAGNTYLADYVKSNFKIKTIIVPTTIDLSKYPEKKQKSGSKFIIGWLGSYFTNEYLLLIKDAINEFLETTDSEFHIVSSRFETLKNHFPSKTTFIEWNPDTYTDQIAQFNIGIMPMPNEEWVKGKCSFKMLQYMGAHLPVVVAPYGMNLEILNTANCGLPAETNQEWLAAFNNYYNNDTLQLEHGLNGRQLVEKEFAIDFNFTKILRLFDSL